MIYLWMSIIIVCCYLIGNINFARIFTWELKRKDITKEGSGNPGMTNVLRTHGFGMAILTMLFEFIKGGVPALVAAIVMDKYYPGMFYVVDLTAGLAAMLGQIFPVIYKFKGGKGLAVFVGVFFFSPLWWVALALFFIFAVISFFCKYGAHINLPYIFLMSGAVTIYNIFFWNAPSPYWWIAIVLVWAMFLLEIVMHRKNIQRLFHKKENKIDFEKSLKEFWGKLTKNKQLTTDQKAKTEDDEKPENEIVVEDDEDEEILKEYDNSDEGITMEEIIENEELLDDDN